MNKREEELTMIVKALEWKEVDLRVANPPLVIWEAKTPFLNYTLESVMDRPWFCHFICAHFTDLDEAKAAAQADYDARIRSALLPNEGGALAELSKLTFVVQHNPNCPSPWLVRLPGKGPIDMLPYGDPFGVVKHQTGDVLGFGKTFEEAARAALAKGGDA